MPTQNPTAAAATREDRRTYWIAHHAASAIQITMNVSATMRSRKPPCRYNQLGIVSAEYSAAARAAIDRVSSRRTIENRSSVVIAAARMSIHATLLACHPNTSKAVR